MIEFLTPPLDDALQESRVYAENECKRLMVSGNDPEECCKGLSSMGLPFLAEGKTWREVKLALIIEKLINQ